ncbi:hypothetical protein ACOMHN_003999 [Nucella lapillus]
MRQPSQNQPSSHITSYARRPRTPQTEYHPAFLLPQNDHRSSVSRPREETSDPFEIADVVPFNVLSLLQDTDDEDDYTQEDEMTFQQSATSGNDTDNDEHQLTWYEKSKAQACSDVRFSVDESQDIKLSEKQAERFKRDGNGERVYPEYEKNPKRLLDSDRRKYKRCQMRIDSPSQSVAKVLDNSSKYSEIVIDGRSKAGRTFMHDEVVVKILSEPKKNRHVRSSRASTKQPAEDIVYGQVVGLLKRVKFANVAYPVLYCKLGRRGDVLMRPLCKTVPKIHVQNDFGKKNYRHQTKRRIEIKKITADGNLVHKDVFDVDPSKREQCVFKVVLLGWKPSCHYPLGAVLRVDLYGSDQSSELDRLTMQHSIPELFPAGVVEETETMSEEDILMQRAEREILTDERTFTIDGPDSKDLDDAISVREEGSRYIVGVHISDVASMVKKDSAIDVEAKKRAVTNYPLHRQPHPMLPEPLCHDLCSLLPGKERLALSVWFTFPRDGSQMEEPPTMQKSVIKSRQQLTYEQVQRVIDGKSPEDVDLFLQSDIRILHNITKNLRESRKKESVLFNPFSDPRLPDPNKVIKDREAHALIEELMIVTNSHIASHLSKKKGLQNRLLVRCQKAPSSEQLSEWRQREGEVAGVVMQLQGKTVGPDSQLTLSVSPRDGPHSHVLVQRAVWQKLRQCLEQGDKQGARNLAFTDDLHPPQFLANKHWIDMMESARYKCYHGLNKPQVIHFDLDRDLYTHFTSPIRRYADLYVQRVLHDDLDQKVVGCLPEHDECEELCLHLNGATYIQKAFTEGCRHLEAAESLRQQPLVFLAYVETVDRERLTVCIPSLCQLSQWKQELPFSILGISCQPELTTDTARQQDSVTVQWKKRLHQYEPDHVTRQPNTHNTAGRNSFTILRQHPICVSVKYEEWRSILKVLSADDDLPEMPNLTKKAKAQSGMENVPFNDSSTPSQHPVEFQSTYTPGQVLQLQMSAAMEPGNVELRVDTLRVAGNLELCTQHRKEPVPVLFCRAKYETANQDFSQCRNYKEACGKYLKAWIPLIEMKAADDAGHSPNSIVIDNVVVTMDKNTSRKKTQFSGSFNLSAKFCRDRDIEFGGKHMGSFGQKQLKTSGKFALDFLCLRYRTKCPEAVQSRIKQSVVSMVVDRYYTWVAHGWVVTVDNKNDGGHFVVTFLLTPASPPPVQQLTARDGASLTVEILPKADVDRRAQEMLYQLKDAVQTLPRALALGTAIPSLDAEHHEEGQKLISSGMEVTAGQDSQRPLPKNNPGQKTAIEKALTSSLTLIRGPPGTGKTNTGIKLVYLFCEINRRLQAEGRGKKTVMYCGPSNKSVDLVARELRAKLGQNCPRIVRVYGALIESQDYPVPGRDRAAARDARALHSDLALRDISLHHVIRQRGKPYADQLQNFDEKFRRCIAYPSTYGVDSQDLKEYRELLFEACKEELAYYECILTTCAMATKAKLTDKSSVFQILIDECGMCTEPDTLAPIIAMQARQVVLIGDHMQLRPIIKCREAADLGLDQSLFERLLDIFPDTSVLLKDQYRMHPEICAFPSTEFYEGNLETKPPGRLSQVRTWNVDSLPFWPRRFPQLLFPGSEYERGLGLASQAVPHLLVNVKGMENMLTVTTEEGNEKSKSNAAEADKVMEILAYLKTVHQVNLKTVKVLTQYNAQRHLLEQKVAEACEDRRNDAFDGADRIRLLQDTQLITTVVSSQGDEWDYVILSTVRSLSSFKIEARPTFGWCSRHLGFITDQHQVNVALTRARRGLFIVGNMELLRCDEVWRRLVKRYQDLGCVREAAHFPPRR